MDDGDHAKDEVTAAAPIAAVDGNEATAAAPIAAVDGDAAMNDGIAVARDDNMDDATTDDEAPPTEREAAMARPLAATRVVALASDVWIQKLREGWWAKYDAGSQAWCVGPLSLFCFFHFFSPIAQKYLMKKLTQGWAGGETRAPCDVACLAGTSSMTAGPCSGRTRSSR